MVSVKYSGPWAEASGYAQANRNIIQSLHEAGVNLATELQVYAQQNTNYGEQYEIAKSYQNKNIDYPVKVLHITPNVYKRHKEDFKYHIGHLFWETTKMNKNWAWYLNEVMEIWTGSEYNVKCFRDVGFSGEIFKFPQPINIDPPKPDISLDNSKGFVFGSVFQWIERKDPASLLKAYWQEFENERDVTLAIKTYGLAFGGREQEKIYTEIARLKASLKLSNYPRVLIIDYLLSDNEIHGFYEACDAMVFSHRGEGWHVPGVEALIHGKPLISVPLGGMYEWIPQEAFYGVKYSMTDVFNMDRHEQYTEPGNQWAQVDVKDLRKKMREVFETRDTSRAEYGMAEAKKMFNFKRVGNMMKKRLEEIYQKQGFK